MSYGQPQSAGPQNGLARLAAGNAAPTGLWEYGRLEILIDGIWNVLGERRNRFGELGRRGALVACRSLSYTTGAQIVVGSSSPFPAPVSVPRLVENIFCNGAEASLADCDIRVDDGEFSPGDYRFDYLGDFHIGSVALVCATPSGKLYLLSVARCSSKPSPHCT